jgi:hypothetical protein
VPLTNRVDLYPGLDFRPDLSLSMVLLDVRVKPIASYGVASAWYVGGGTAIAGGDLVSDLLTGVQWPTGRWRPFFEAHLFNGLNGGGVLHAGLAVPIF